MTFGVSRADLQTGTVQDKLLGPVVSGHRLLSRKLLRYEQTVDTLKLHQKQTENCFNLNFFLLSILGRSTKHLFVDFFM